ncbi:hypothetical protein C364_04635, partial [Cryptococcus neoformans Bt63]
WQLFSETRMLCPTSGQGHTRGLHKGLKMRT